MPPTVDFDGGDELSDLPLSAREIAEVIGRDSALELISSLPVSGSRSWRRVLYVPKNLPPGHWLIRKLGLKKATALSYAFPGMSLQPANCRVLDRLNHRRLIPELIANGVDFAEVADLCNLSTYRVREIFAELTSTHPDWIGVEPGSQPDPPIDTVARCVCGRTYPVATVMSGTDPFDFMLLAMLSGWRLQSGLWTCSTSCRARIVPDRPAIAGKS